MHPLGGEPNKNVKLTWHTGCSNQNGLMMKFLPADDGSFYIQNTKTGFCAHPQGGTPNANVRLIWHPGCSDSNKRLRFTKVHVEGGYFYLRSNMHGKRTFCVHPKGGNARTNVEWIFNEGCSGTRLQFKQVFYPIPPTAQPRKHSTAAYGEWQDSKGKWNCTKPLEPLKPKSVEQLPVLQYASGNEKKSWLERSMECAAQGKRLCKRNEVCNGKTPLFSNWKGLVEKMAPKDQWLAVGDSRNAWIHVGGTKKKCNVWRRPYFSGKRSAFPLRKYTACCENKAEMVFADCCSKRAAGTCGAGITTMRNQLIAGRSSNMRGCSAQEYRGEGAVGRTINNELQCRSFMKSQMALMGQKDCDSQVCRGVANYYEWRATEEKCVYCKIEIPDTLNTNAIEEQKKRPFPWKFVAAPHYVSFVHGNCKCTDKQCTKIKTLQTYNRKLAQYKKNKIDYDERHWGPSKGVGCSVGQGSTENKMYPVADEAKGAFFKPAKAEVFVCTGDRKLGNGRCGGGPAKVLVKGLGCKIKKVAEDFQISNNFTVERSHITGEHNLFPVAGLYSTSSTPQEDSMLSDTTSELLEMPLDDTQVAFLDEGSAVESPKVSVNEIAKASTLPQKVEQLKLCASKGFEVSMSVKMGSKVKGTLLSIGGAVNAALKSNCGGLQFYVSPDGFLGVKNSCDKPHRMDARAAFPMYAMTEYKIKFSFFKNVLDIFVNGVLRKSVAAKTLLIPCKGQINVGGNGKMLSPDGGKQSYYLDPFKFGKITGLVIEPPRKQGAIHEGVVPITKPKDVLTKDLKYLNLNGNFVVQMRVKTGKIVNGDILSLGGNKTHSKDGEVYCGGIRFFLRKNSGSKAVVGFGHQCNEPTATVLDVVVPMKPNTWYDLKFEFLNRRAKIYVNNVVKKQSSQGMLPLVVPTSGIVSIGEGGHVNGVQSPFQFGVIKDVYIGATQPPARPPSPPGQRGSSPAAASPEIAAKRHYYKVLTANNVEVKFKQHAEHKTKQFTIAREARSKKADLQVESNKLQASSDRYKITETFVRKKRDNHAAHAESTLKSVLEIVAKEYNAKVFVRKELYAKANMVKIMEEQEDQLGHREMSAKNRTRIHVQAREKVKKSVMNKEIGDKKSLMRIDLHQEVACKLDERRKKDGIKELIEQKSGGLAAKEKAHKAFVQNYVTHKNKANEDFISESKRKHAFHGSFNSKESGFKVKQNTAFQEVSEKGRGLRATRRNEINQKKGVCMDRNTETAKDRAYNITAMEKHLYNMKTNFSDLTGMSRSKNSACITFMSNRMKTNEEQGTPDPIEARSIQVDHKKCMAKVSAMEKAAFHVKNQMKAVKSDIRYTRFQAMRQSCSCFGPCFKKNCPTCPLGETRVNIARRHPTNLQCLCRCGCRPKGESAPKNFKTATNPKNGPKVTYVQKLGKTASVCTEYFDEKMKSSTKVGSVFQCAKGPEYRGWFRGKHLKVACGCPGTPFEEHFKITQDVTAPAQCPPVQVTPPTLQPSFSDWYHICKLKAKTWSDAALDAKHNNPSYLSRYTNKMKLQEGGAIQNIKQLVTILLKGVHVEKWVARYDKQSKQAAEKAFLTALGSSGIHPKTVAVSSTAVETTMENKVALEFEVTLADANRVPINTDIKVLELNYDFGKTFHGVNTAAPTVVEVGNPKIVRGHPKLPIQSMKEKLAVMKRQEQLDWATQKAKTQLETETNHEIKQVGYKWASNRKIEIKVKEQDVWDDAVSGNVTCKAVFMSGWMVCDRGHKIVPVRCNTGWAGDLSNVADSKTDRILISAGCGCNGGFIAGKVAGRMTVTGAKPCLDWFQKTSQQLRARLYKTAQAQQCAAKVIARCQQGLKQNEKAIASKNAKMDMLRGQKKLAFTQARKAVSKTVDTVIQKHARLHKENIKREYKYSKIAGFGLPGTTQGERVDDNVICRQKCGDQGLICKGYSYNKATKQCVWSTSGIVYDDNYVLYLRPGSDELSEGFTAIPGMVVGEVSDVRDPLGDTLKECEGKCMSSDRCRSMSYSEHKKHCVISDLKVEVGSNWDYYERDYTKSAKQLNDEARVDLAPDLTTSVMKKSEKGFVDAARGANVQITEVQKQLDGLRVAFAGTPSLLLELGNSDTHGIANLDGSDEIGEGMGAHRGGYLSTTGSFSSGLVSGAGSEPGDGVAVADVIYAEGGFQVSAVITGSGSGAR